MPADYCGGFTIDNIDQFGTLEQINVSFDDPAWDSATTCIYYGDASIGSSAAASASAYAIREAIGNVDSSATVIGSAFRIRVSSGAISGNATASADGWI